MSWLNMLGFACLDPMFRYHLYKDLKKTTRVYGFHLPSADFQVAGMIFADKENFEAAFMKVQDRICTRPPCRISDDLLAIIGAVLMDPALLEELFKDPIRFLEDHGFHLHHLDIYVLTTMLGEKREELKKELRNLGDKIRALMESKRRKAAA